eukprot:TRINITY_DN61_c0_g1_i1.p1 TRINITY_DN61_c0_g1~~TRINITY_DN61_c0_g1_i1.p1  ORF type:complete len:123 (-),score=19.18 TRINITY_DN61_c0_g1_i1:52-420(-)
MAEEDEQMDDVDEPTVATGKVPVIKQPFTLKKWSAVVKWKYDVPTEVCAICRNNLMEDCIECLGNPDSVLAANCKVAFGECGHAYHFHCIHKWLEKANGTNQCPMDGQEWEYARFTERGANK